VFIEPTVLEYGSHPLGHEACGQNNRYASPPLVGIFNIVAGVMRKGEKVGAIGLEPCAEWLIRQLAQPLSGCGARKLAFLKTEIESFMPFYQAEKRSAESFNN